MTIPDDESLRYKVLHDQDFDLEDGGGGAAPASRYEAGGADPITNLGEPFSVKGTDNETVFSVTNDVAASDYPIVTIGGVSHDMGPTTDKIVLHSTGPLVEMFNDVDALQMYWTGEGFHAGIGITVGDETLDAFSLTGPSGAGKFLMRDASQMASFELSMANDQMYWLHGNGTAYVLWDTSELFLQESSLVLREGKIELQDEFGSPASAFVILAGVDGNYGKVKLSDTVNGIDERVVIAADATGLTLYDSDADVQVNLAESASGGALTLYDEDGADPQVLDHDTLALLLALLI